MLKSDHGKRLKELTERIKKEIELTAIHGFDADKYEVEPILAQEKKPNKSQQSSESKKKKNKE